MTNDKFQEKMNSIQQKLGQDASNLILDEIGELLTDNKNMNDELSKKDTENESLRKTNETLQRVNGNLLQQVAMGDDESITQKEKKEEKPKDFDFRTVFDEKRKFQKIS